MNVSGDVLWSIAWTEVRSNLLGVPQKSRRLYAISSYVWSYDSSKVTLAAAPTKPMPFPRWKVGTPFSLSWFATLSLFTTPWSAARYTLLRNGTVLGSWRRTTPEFAPFPTSDSLSTIEQTDSKVSFTSSVSSGRQTAALPLVLKGTLGFSLTRRG